MRRSSDSKRTDDAALERLAGHVQVLAERVDTLARTVATTSSASARTDGEIALLRRELESGLTQVAALASEGRAGAGAGEIRELRAQVSALAADRAKTADSKRIDDLSGKVAVLAQRVDTLASTVATAAASVAGRDGEVAALRRQLEQGTGPRPAALDEKLLRRVQDAASASAAVSMRVERQREELETMIGRVEARDEEVRSALADLRGVLDGLAARVAAFEAESRDRSRDEIAVRLNELVRRLEAMNERYGAEAPELRRATSLLPTALRALENGAEQPPQSSPERPTERRPAPGDDHGVVGGDVQPVGSAAVPADAGLPFRGTST